MPWQLIYTSAPRGLLSGQSGFCTVARSADLREALAQRLEQISSYNYLRVAEAATANRNPTVCAFRILDLRGSKYHVLTRIQPCGLDFTARTNHLAHHLVFQADELAQLPSPAVILRDWPGWLPSWQGEPRILDDPALNSFNAAARPSLPAQTWMRMTGDAGRAAGLLESECIRGCYLVCPPGSEQQVLEMFCETLQLLNLNGQYALRPWRHPFTTFLQAEDNPADFQWRACQEGTPACRQAEQRPTALIPLRSVRVPNNSLVKTAREGLKPPPPPAASKPVTLPLQRQASGQRPSGLDSADTAYGRKPLPRPERPALLDLNFSINAGSLVRIGIFVAVLLGLLVMKHNLSKKPATESIPEAAPAPVVFAPPARLSKPDNPGAVQTSSSQTRPFQIAPPDPAQLIGLSGDEPTYVIVAANVTNFILPLDSISRFQNLLENFDTFHTLPKDIQLSVDTDKWDFRTGVPLTVNGRREQVLSAFNGSGLDFLFDYSNWKNNPKNPVAVHASFPAPVNAFSVHFSFSTNGDPFRLLIVSESSPPVPLHLPMQWLRANPESVEGPFRVPLGERLMGHFTLFGGWHWQLQPFIRGKGAGQTYYLYKDWPPKYLPPPGHELDFAAVKRPLKKQLASLREADHSLSVKLESQIQNAGLDKPLGKTLKLTNEHLTSFSTWTNAPPSPVLYLSYLHHLRTSGIKDHPEMKTWPTFAKEDTDAELAEKFAKLTALWIDLFPAAQPYLKDGNTNYFSNVWLKLKEIQRNRQDRWRVQDEMATLRQRLDAVPERLDNVAFVSLFLVDPPKAGLEVIRFEGP